MTYGQVKKQSLQLIFSESIAGTPIASTYNNQADYERMIPGLVNDAMMYIATTVKKIPAMVKLDSLLTDTENEEFDIYRLPDDCFEMVNGGLVLQHKKNDFGEIARRVHKVYRLYGGNQLWLPKGVGERKHLYLEYWRYPKQFSDNPDENEELDNTPDTHACIPYWVAAQAVMYDDAFRHATLYNTWEDRLARLKPNPTFIEDDHIDDVYGFDCFGGWFG